MTDEKQSTPAQAVLANRINVAMSEATDSGASQAEIIEILRAMLEMAESEAVLINNSTLMA